MNWNSSSVVGASLSIPIFDGSQKRQQVKQSKLNLQSIQLDRELTKNQLNTQYVNAEKKYMLNQVNAPPTTSGSTSLTIFIKGSTSDGFTRPKCKSDR